MPKGKVIEGIFCIAMFFTACSGVVNTPNTSSLPNTSSPTPIIPPSPTTPPSPTGPSMYDTLSAIFKDGTTWNFTRYDTTYKTPNYYNVYNNNLWIFNFFLDSLRPYINIDPTYVVLRYVNKTIENWTINGRITFGNLRNRFSYYISSYYMDTIYNNATINYLYKTKKTNDSTNLKIIALNNPQIGLSDSLFVFLDSSFFATIGLEKINTLPPSQSKQTDNSPLFNIGAFIPLQIQPTYTNFGQLTNYSKDSIYIIDQKGYKADFCYRFYAQSNSGNGSTGGSNNCYLFFSIAKGLIMSKIENGTYYQVGSLSASLSNQTTRLQEY